MFNSHYSDSVRAEIRVAEIDERPRVVYRSQYSDNSSAHLVTLDVFWCSGDNYAAGRALDASSLAGVYAAASLSTTGHSLLGEVRTRPIDFDTFAANATPDELASARDTVLIRFDSSEERARFIVDSIVKIGIRRTTISKSNLSSLPNYISAFVCNAVDASLVRGRLFFHVARPEQRPEAESGASVIRTAFRGISVASGVEVVGAISPRLSEVRYFFREDADLAAQIASTLSLAGSTHFFSKYVPGFERRVRKGTLEAWLAGP
jgi:hypothetical protein